MDNELDILPVFNTSLDGESIYTIYQGQINAYRSLDQSMLEAGKLQEGIIKL